MSNIAISEIQNTVTEMKSSDLMLVSKRDSNNDTYTTAKTTFDKVIKPSVIYCEPQNSVQYSIANGTINLLNTESRDGNQRLHFWKSNQLLIPSDYVTIDGYVKIIYEATTDYPGYGANMYLYLSNGNHDRMIWRSGTTNNSETGTYHCIQPVTIAKEDINYVYILTGNISANSEVRISMYW